MSRADKGQDMSDSGTFQDRLDAASEKLRSRLGVRGPSFGARIRRAGRALPKPARLAGRRLVELQKMAAHPRLRRIIRRDDFDAALAELNAHLDKVNAGERRKDRLLGLAGSVVGNLLLLGAAVIALLYWRGIL